MHTVGEHGMCTHTEIKSVKDRTARVRVHQEVETKTAIGQWHAMSRALCEHTPTLEYWEVLQPCVLGNIGTGKS